MATKTDGALLFQEKIKAANKEAFLDKVRSVSAELGIDPNWLMAVIHSESAGTFSPSIVNPTTGATGLIQFMPDTARGLGTTTLDLANMSNVKQLDYVKKYLKGSKYSRFEDLYAKVFYPVSIGKPSSYIIGSEKSMDYAKKVAKQNPAISRGKQVITAGDFREWVKSRLPQSALDVLVGVAKRNKNTIAIILGVLALGGIIYYITKND